MLERISNLSVGFGRRGDAAQDESFLSARVNFRVSYLDEVLAPTPRTREKEPLIDVIESRDAYRIVVLLPGVRKEDVRVAMLPNSVRVDVARNGIMHSKEFPCTAPPATVEVVSEKERNSVVEIVFRKGRRQA